MRRIFFILVFFPIILFAQVSFTNLGGTAGNTPSNPDFTSNADQTSYSNTSWTPPTSGLIIVFVIGDKASGSGTPTTPSMSGNGITWSGSAINPLDCGGRVGLSVFVANASGSTTGATTVTFGSTNQTLCSFLFMHATNVNFTPSLPATIVQIYATTGSGTSASIGLTGAASIYNRPIAAFYKDSNVLSTPRANWTEMDDLTTVTELHSLETQVRSDAFDTDASASWTGTLNYGGMACEIRGLLSAPAGNTGRVIIIKP